MLSFFIGRAAGTGGVVTLWLIGLVWLLKQRREDPARDRRLPKRDRP